MNKDEFDELLIKLEKKYGSVITARFEVGLSVRNQLEAYIEISEDDDGFVMDEEGFLEYITDCVTDYLFESSRSDFDGIQLLTEKGEEL
jgi:hypothetical protein